MQTEEGKKNLDDKNNGHAMEFSNSPHKNGFVALRKRQKANNNWMANLVMAKLWPYFGASSPFFMAFSFRLHLKCKQNVLPLFFHLIPLLYLSAT